MHAKMAAARPSDTMAFNNLQGRRIQTAPKSSPSVWWRDADMPAFIMQSNRGPDAAGGAMAMGGLATEMARLHVKALVVVHFFSGYRRTGDIHHIVDHQVSLTGQHIFMLSVDLCMQRKSGDLATPQAAKWWRDRVLSGQVVAAGGGPPCETYTVARQYEGGPRPLRSAEHPLGLPGLHRREWNQLRISDCLLRFLLDILVALATMGMSGFLEHPQFPTWCTRGSPASIWSMEVPKWLKNLNCFTSELRPVRGGCSGAQAHHIAAPSNAECAQPAPPARQLWQMPPPTWGTHGSHRPSSRWHVPNGKSQGLPIRTKQGPRGGTARSRSQMGVRC